VDQNADGCSKKLCLIHEAGIVCRRQPRQKANLLAAKTLKIVA
jgi:hypothetical protein